MTAMPTMAENFSSKCSSRSNFEAATDGKIN
jgi:hypothetical protein